MKYQSIAYRILKYHRLGIKNTFSKPILNSEIRHLLKFQLNHFGSTWRSKLHDIVSLVTHEIPLTYILKSHPFINTNLTIFPRVLVPRNETEEFVWSLIQKIRSDYRYEDSRMKILDLCSGSGCIAIALACNLKNIEVTAVDKSRRCCLNIYKNGLLNRDLMNLSNSKLLIKQADIFEAEFKFDQKYDLIISNPPYIPLSQRKKVDKNVLKFEDRDALFSRSSFRNGIGFHMKIISLSRGLLKDKNNPLHRNFPRILLEFDGEHQVHSLRRSISPSFVKFKFRKDFRGIPRSLWIY